MHVPGRTIAGRERATCARRSEEHTSELQSLAYLVCRLLLEKNVGLLTDHTAVQASEERETILATRGAGGRTGQCVPHHYSRACGARVGSVSFFLNDAPAPKFNPLPHPDLLPI